MRAGNRTILAEMLLAQSAAVGAFAEVAIRCTSLMGQQYQAALARLGTETRLKGAGVRATQPGGGSGFNEESLPSSADICRAFAGLPRISMMVFLARYDGLRGRRSLDRGC